MKILFKPLLSLSVSHAYYGGVCHDLEFVLPKETLRIMRGGKLVARTVQGELRVLYEAQASGTPLVTIVGRTLSIGLRLMNVNFANFTAPEFVPAPTSLFYRNTADATRLDAPLIVRSTGSLISFPLTLAHRPVRVTVRDGDGAGVFDQTTPAGDERDAVSIDLREQLPGRYRVEADYPGGVVDSATYLVHPELHAQGIWGVVELTLSQSMYDSPPKLQVTLPAREQTVKYYVVARNYPDADFARLNVRDAGFGTEGRSEMHFDRVESAAFGVDDLSTELLGASATTRVALFRSQAPAPRRERGPRSLELSNNGETLVSHLPHPAPDRTDADIIIHLVRPKP